MTTTNIPACRYIRIMSLTDNNPVRNSLLSFFPGDPRRLESLGQWVLREIGRYIDFYDFQFHSFDKELSALDQFRRDLLRATNPIDFKKYRARALEETQIFGELLAGAQGAARGLPEYVTSMNRMKKNLRDKEESAQKAFKALNDFLEVRIGLATISMHAEDPTSVYFDSSPANVLTAIGPRVLSK